MRAAIFRNAGIASLFPAYAATSRLARGADEERRDNEDGQMPDEIDSEENMLTELDVKFLASCGVECKGSSLVRTNKKCRAVAATTKPQITQAQLEDFLTLRNVARKVSDLLYWRRKEIVELLISDAEVEPGMRECWMYNPGKPWSKLCVH